MFYRQLDSTERARGAHRPDDGNEFRIGRLKHERVFVPRGDQVPCLHAAANIIILVSLHHPD